MGAGDTSRKKTEHLEFVGRHLIKAGTTTYRELGKKGYEFAQNKGQVLRKKLVF